jgi:ABC-type lipoprotein release transport system permease subunit
MSAILMRLRAETRTRWRSFLVLTLVVGVTGGVVLAAVAGARRTDSAYPRFIAWAHPADSGLFLGGGFGQEPIDPDAVRRLPEVRSTAIGSQVAFTPQAADGRYIDIGQGAGSTSSSSQFEGVQGGRVKVLEGRLADPSKAHEVVVGEGTATVDHVGVGDHLFFRFLKPGEDPTPFGSSSNYADIPKSILTQPFEVTVVGITFSVGDFGDNAFGDVSFTPAFNRTEGPRVARFAIMAVRLRHGTADLPKFQHDIQTLAHGGYGGTGSVLDTFGAFQRTVHPYAAALYLFAILAAVAGLLVFGQSVARLTFVDGAESPTLRAIGMTRSELLTLGLTRAGLIGLAAAALAVVVAVGVSPLMPMGLAKVADPNPGVSVDALVLGIGGAVIVLSVVLAALIPAQRTAAARGDALGTVETTGRTSPAFVPRVLARAGLPPSAVAGARMAVEPGRGRTAVPVRSTIVGGVVAIAAVVASLTFASSFQHLFNTPRLYGWNWDAVVGSPYIDDISAKAVPAIEQMPGIRAFAQANVQSRLDVTSGSEHRTVVPVFGFDQLRGAVHPPIIEGRWPQSPGEIAFGTKTMRELGIGIGDTVSLAAGNATSDRVRVVGRAVFVDTSGTGGLGEGAGMTLDGLHRVLPRIPINVFPVVFEPGPAGRAAAAELAKRFPGGFIGASSEGSNLASTVSGLQNLKPVRRFPLVLAALLGLAAVAFIAHTLVSSIRRRRRDLAVLKTLGFGRGQVSATVAWQATTFGSIALLLGIPIGLAAGRWAWTAYANQLGLFPESVMPGVQVMLVIPTTLLVANLVALVPGWLASRIRPAAALRTE